MHPRQRVALGHLDRVVRAGVVNQNDLEILVVLLKDHGQAMSYPTLFVFGADDDRDCPHATGDALCHDHHTHLVASARMACNHAASA